MVMDNYWRHQIESNLRYKQSQPENKITSAHQYNDELWICQTQLERQRQIDKQLRQQQEFFSSIYEGVEQAIIVVDVLENGTLQCSDLNPISEKIIGINRQQARGKPLEGIFSQDQFPLICQYYEHCIALGKSISYEACLPQGDDQSYWLMTLTPLFNQQGRIYRVVGTGVNIDARKQLENTLKEQAEREHLLNSINQRIRQSLDPHEAVEYTINTLLEVFQVSRVILVAYCKNTPCQDRSCFELVKLASREENSLELENLSCITLHHPDQAQQWFKEHQMIAIEDRERELGSSLLYRTACEMNSQSLLATGIWFDNHLQGEICLHSEEVRHWRKFEKQLLIDLSYQLAITLQQMKLYQQLQTELNRRIELQQQLQYDALHDKLTGLPNRSLLIDRLNHFIRSNPRKQEKTSSFFAILFLDLNRFKPINDCFGHYCGDQLLIEVAQRLKTCLRDEDTIARFGGDEFVILLEHLEQQKDIIDIADRIHQTLSQPILLNNQVEVTVGTSIGIVFYESKYTDSESMLRDADFAMYQAKQNQDDYVIFNDLP